MKHVLPPLDSFKVFEAAARLLSFSAAADELCLSRGAVSYHIQKLEQYIGTQLFQRGVRQVYLTQSGQKLLQSVQFLLKNIEAEIQQIREREYAKGLTIGATTYVSARFLSSRITQYLDIQPQLSFSFLHNVNASDFKIDSADLTIWWGECDVQNSNSNSHLASLEMPLYAAASPSLMQKYQLPKQMSLQDFANLAGGQIPLLNEDRKNDLWQQWYGAQPLRNPRRVIGDANVRVQAAIEGQGFILADELMQTELNNGLLVSPCQHQLQGFGYNLYSEPVKRLNPQCQTFVDWLISNF